MSFAFVLTYLLDPEDAVEAAVVLAGALLAAELSEDEDDDLLPSPEALVALLLSLLDSLLFLPFEDEEYRSAYQPPPLNCTAGAEISFSR